MTPSRRAAAALTLAATLCVAHVLGSAASASAGLLGAVTLDPAAPFGLRSDLVVGAGLDGGGDAYGVGARGSRLLRAAGGTPAGGALGAALQVALDAAGVPPGARLHAAHATGEQAPFLRNWARHARVQRIPHLALLALDADAAAAGERLGLLTFKCARRWERLALTALAHAPACVRRSRGLPASAWREQQPCACCQSTHAPPCHRRSVPELLLLTKAGPAGSASGGAFSAVLPLLQALLALGHDVLLSETDVARAPPHTRAHTHARACARATSVPFFSAPVQTLKRSLSSVPIAVVLLAAGVDARPGAVPGGVRHGRRGRAGGVGVPAPLCRANAG
jgi:hypothetical protein